jgi:polysaccharide export outer membrane protein
MSFTITTASVLRSVRVANGNPANSAPIPASLSTQEASAMWLIRSTFCLLVRIPRAVGIPALLLLAASACSEIPKDGPTGVEIRGSAEITLEDPGRLSYALAKLTPLVVAALRTEAQPPVRFSQLARYGPAADGRIGPGDIVSVSIFEASSGGLFVPAEAGARPGNFVQIPVQEIDRTGNITVPYGGTIRAVGRTPREIEKEIEEKLRESAIRPQAVVSLGERSSNAVSVLGDVNAPALIPLKPGGLRLLSGIARAGGARYAAYDTIVTLQRGRRTEQALLTSIIKDSSQNIQLAPGDVVNVSFHPRIFLNFGATAAQAATVSIGNASVQSGRRLSFDAENLTLAEGLAKSGGLVELRADPRSVFLFRYVPRALLESAGVDVRNFVAADVPTVFTLDLSQAEGYFLANQFYMKHLDVIFVSDSPSVDLLKFLAIVTAITSSTRDAIGVVSDVKALR